MTRPLEEIQELLTYLYQVETVRTMYLVLADNLLGYDFKIIAAPLLTKIKCLELELQFMLPEEDDWIQIPNHIPKVTYNILLR